ncbi:MAG: family 10 glycosylhydrolase [Candidatus Aenigmarchaeota archaeon]|nr:family 10 glycosylhydrolase [Candidatus Aenigmarchaeota archaeon]
MLVNKNLIIKVVGIILLLILVFFTISTIFSQHDIIEDDDTKPDLVAQFTIYDLYDRGLDSTFKKLKEDGYSIVIVQVFPDNEQGVFWDSKIAPVNEDLLKNAVTSAHSNGLKIWAWAKTLDTLWLYDDNDEWKVKALESDGYTYETGWYKRISPCVDEHILYLKKLFREIVTDYEIDGILLQDDLYLGGNEDFSETCREKYLSDFGEELSKDVLMKDNYNVFSTWRTGYITNVISEIGNEIKSVRPEIKLAVNIYPSCVTNMQECLNDNSQNVSEIVKYADYIVLMAYHKLDGKSVNWISEITTGAIAIAGKEKVIIKLQTVDWSTGNKLDNDEMKHAIDTSTSSGAEIVAFFPS